MRKAVEVTIRDLECDDQDAVKELILAGLEEHWGWRDPTATPDLDDIAGNYAGATFLVASDRGQIVGAGALVAKGDGVGEIVRMSVSQERRRQGIGAALLSALRSRAEGSGLRRLTLETTATWHDVIAFYASEGFRFTHERDGDAYFAFDLDQTT